MLNLKLTLRALALLVMSLWAQNAAALDCGSARGTLGGNSAAELFANANEDTCGSTAFNVGPTKNGHIFVASEFGIGVQFIYNGLSFAPGIKSLSCTGSTSGSSSPFSILQNFPSAAAYSTVCTLNYTDIFGTQVTHIFGAGSTFAGSVLVGFLNPSTVTSGWFDRTSPTVVLSGVTGTLPNGAIAVTATFSENVASFSPADLSLVNATVASVTVLSGSTFEFDLVPVTTGAFSAQLPANAITDLPGNGNIASNTLGGTADFTSPTVELTGLAAIIGSAPQTITATFSEDVIGFTLDDLIVTNATVSNLLVVNDSTYRFDVSANGAGNISLSIPAAVVTDISGNPNTASGSVTALLDIQPPTVTISDMPAEIYDIPKTVTAVFSEDVTGFSLAASVIAVKGLTLSNLVVIDAATYQFDIAATTTGTVTLRIPSNVLTDQAGNFNERSPNYSIDSLGTATRIVSDFSLSPGTSVPYTDSVSYIDNSTPTTGETITSWFWDFGDGNASTDQNSVHSYDVPGSYWVELTVCDAGGCDRSLTIITITNPLGTTLSGFSGSISGPQTITLQTQSRLDATALGGLTLADFETTNLTLSDLVLVSRGGWFIEPDTYSFIATPDGSGAVSLSLPAGVIANESGVQNEASNILNGAADLDPPTVVISGLPAELNGPANFGITIVFSEAVTGFTQAEIDISGGTITDFAGSGTTYTATVNASGGEDLVISLAAGVASDGAGNPSQASAVATVVNVILGLTAELIEGFMQTRANALLSHQPDLTSFLRGGGAGQFAAEVTRDGGMVNFDSGTDGPIWARLNANWSTDLGAESEYIFGVVGGHSKLSENFLIGGMVQVDHLREVNGAATTSGSGWLIGPYFAAKLATQPLYFEGSLLYGQTSNTISPLGTFEDNFRTERWLATLGITGEVERGNLTLLPFLDAKYTSDAQAAYLDGLGNSIAAQTVGLAQAAAGLDFELALSTATTLNGGVSGTWSYSSGGAVTPGYEGGRARLDLGVAHRFGKTTLSLSGYYDGLGAADFDSYGAELLLQAEF